MRGPNRRDQTRQAAYRDPVRWVDSLSTGVDWQGLPPNGGWTRDGEKCDANRTVHEDTPRPPRSYGSRWLRETFGATFTQGSLRALVTAIATAATTFGLVNLLAAGDDRRIGDAALGAIVGLIAVLVLGVLFFLSNLVLAPMRLERHARSLSDAAIAERDERLARVQSDLESAIGARDGALGRLAAREAATQVTVEVSTALDGHIQSVDVSDPAIGAWLDRKRTELGDPGGPAVARDEQFRAALDVLSLRVQEKRTPEAFRAEVAAWMAIARPAADAEILRLALFAPSSVLHIIAKNTGNRHLSEVGVTLTLEAAGRATWYGSHPASDFPDAPAKWGTSTRWDSAVYGLSLADRIAEIGHGDIRYRDDQIIIECQPFSLPPGDEEEAGAIVLAFAHPGVGPSVRYSWRVTAREGEGDAKGTGAIPIMLPPRRPEDVEAAYASWFDDMD